MLMKTSPFPQILLSVRFWVCEQVRVHPHVIVLVQVSECVHVCLFTNPICP